MRPLFTVHAGEFIVGEFIEQTFRNLNVWLPSKDTGIDFLVTDKKNKSTVSLQVKLSRDYRQPEAVDDFQQGLVAAGWLTLSHEKIEKSQANYWVFVLVSNERKWTPHFIVIKPVDLLARLRRIHGNKRSYHFYPWIINTNDNSRIALQGRGLNANERLSLMRDGIKDEDRNFTTFLENWSALEKLNKIILGLQSYKVAVLCRSETRLLHLLF